MRHLATSAVVSLAAALGTAACACSSASAPVSTPSPQSTKVPLEGPRLVGRAVLPAATFAAGPPSGARLGATPINGQALPFPSQPVQGFSAVLDAGSGAYLAMADNGYGALENSADFRLRVYTVRPSFPAGRTGALAVEGFFELRDPDRRVPFAIVNQLTIDRVLTGADLDIESMQRAPDGTLWFGDEFGPFLVHTDSTGKVLEAPFPVPDPDDASKELRAPQSPRTEEASAVRIMNAASAHARNHGAARAPVFSPYHAMLVDGDAATGTGNRETPPAGAGLATATSEIFDIASMQSAGFPVVAWTVDDLARMEWLFSKKVTGIISDRPDLLRQLAESHREVLDPSGLLDIAKLDAQGHRGGRDLRPENTLPAFEAALDALVTTLELDVGVTRDGVPVIDHDPVVSAQKCRRADGGAYAKADEVLLRDLDLAHLRATFVCDRTFRGAQQLNDVTLSPVAREFANGRRLPHPYAMATLPELFAFVDAYVAYHKAHGNEARWRNAERVRFNVETKVNPRAAFRDRTLRFEQVTDAVVKAILDAKLAARADVQSFDFRTLLRVQEQHPELRTVYLFGDFPVYADGGGGTDDGTNLQDESGANTPWMAGMAWPYRQTAKTNPLRVQRSGGFEGMALSKDGRHLYPMLEKPLVGGEKGVLTMFDFDLAQKRFVGVRARYPLDARGVGIGDFIMTDETHGLVIERDDTQGDPNGFKQIVRVTLGPPGALVEKHTAVDLMRLADPDKIGSTSGVFDFPFQTIEDLLLLPDGRLLVMNDNNYPFGLGRHAADRRPDEEEMLLIDLGTAP